MTNVTDISCVDGQFWGATLHFANADTRTVLVLEFMWMPFLPKPLDILHATVDGDAMLGMRFAGSQYAAIHAAIAPIMAETTIRAD